MTAKLFTADDDTKHCGDCFVASGDDYKGNAYPAMCGDGDCSCHRLTLTEKPYADPRLGPLGHRVYELYENGRLIAAQHSQREYVAAYVRKFPDGITFELLAEVPCETPEGVYGLATLSEAWTDGTPVEVGPDGMVVLDANIGGLITNEREYREAA